ncbi:hypothetical protein BDQ17DRAFT_1428012 [Cyathus striatus]|nr:hypothetical protein BDQ17DRAFT_1428012 [Cyathus striatus]
MPSSLFRFTKKAKQRKLAAIAAANAFVPLSPQLCERITLDIVEVIISFFHSDKKSLAACSLVCRAWLPTTRHHLQISIRPKVADGFFRIVEQSVSTLPHYARRVAVEQDFGFDLPPSLLQRARHAGHGYDHTPYMFNDILSHLTSFTNITTLCLYENPVRSVTSISHIDAFPCLEELELHSFTFSCFATCINTVCAPPNLNKLSLNDVRWVENVEETTESKTSSEHEPQIEYETGSKDAPPIEIFRALPPHLRILEIYIKQRATLLDWILDSQNMEGITSLKLGFSHPSNGNDDSSLSRFLKELGPGLQNLRLYTSGPNRQVDITHNTGLRALHIVHAQGVDPHHSEDTASTHSISAILSQVASSNIVAITCELFIWEVDVLRALDWKIINRILSLPQFANLQSLQFQVPAGREQIAEYLDRKLPNPTRRQVLSVVHADLANIRAMLS